MKKIVVTGATSMIGIALIEECIKNGVEVLAIARPETMRLDRIPSSPLVTVEKAEIKNLTQIDCSGCDVFYHFAWAHIIKSERNDPVLQSENIGLTLEAARAAKAMGCRKFIGAGSQAEYGIVNDIITPHTPVSPVTAYGTAKYAAGRLAKLYCEQEKIHFHWVRILSVYGPNDNSDSMINTAINKMLHGEECKFTPATHMWNYLYSADAGRAFYLLGEKSAMSDTYCLGSCDSRPLKDYITVIRDIINPNLALRIGEIPYNGTPVSLRADISCLTSETGFIPETSFEDGIKNTILFILSKDIPAIS